MSIRRLTADQFECIMDTCFITQNTDLKKGSGEK